MSARGLMIGAPRSGSGKTSVTIGILRALKRRGISVSGIKSGPDYIDPGFHQAATGHPGVNLDSWAMEPALLDTLASGAAADAEVVVVESAMGLFDGIPAPPERSGAAADLAKRYHLPVLLVLDVSGQGRTAAATALGFRSYDPAVQIGGVILNRAGSERHRRMSGDAIEALGIPVLGCVMRDPTLSLPERHLGLVQAGEHAALDAFIERMADTMETSLDLDRILALAAPFEPAHARATALSPPGQRVAIAQDAAFSFVYPHLTRQWREAGAELVPFSPLADESPDLSCDACWLPGGYPELHGSRLSEAKGFQAGMSKFAQSRPVHGECGGFMVLGRSITDADGIEHPMLGLLGHKTSFAKRAMNLGYRQARLLHDCAIGRAGDTVRGHEFHYARVTDAGSDTALAEIADGGGTVLGPSGARRGHVSGTFFHAIARG